MKAIDDDDDDHFHKIVANFNIDTPTTIGDPAYSECMIGMRSVTGRRPTPIVCRMSFTN